MEREQREHSSVDEARQFAKFLKQLNQAQQVGLQLILAGVKLLTEKNSGFESR